MKAALDQFIDGLKESGLLSSIQEYPDFFKDLFVKSNKECFSAGNIFTRLTVFLSISKNCFNVLRFNTQSTGR